MDEYTYNDMINLLPKVRESEYIDLEITFKDVIS